MHHLKNYSCSLSEFDKRNSFGESMTKENLRNFIIFERYLDVTATGASGNSCEN